MQKVATGIPALDAVLDGGLPKNRIHLIQGSPGTGKTTLALQFLRQGLEEGDRVLYVTLSETKEELSEAAESHQWDLSPITIFELSAADQFTDLGLDQTIFPSSEVELTETTKSLLAILQQSQPQRVVFDTLSEMRLLSGDQLRYRKQILMLKQQLQELGATVLFLDDDLEASKDMQSMVTGVIELSNQAPDYGGNRRRLLIRKMRGCAYIGGYHDFAIRRDGIDVYPRLTAADTRGDDLSEQVSTGSETFDLMLGGGLDAGTSTLIMGPAGSGKSTITAQVAASAAKQGIKSAFFIFDERPQTLRARTHSLGIPLEELIAEGMITLQQVDPAELSPGEFADAVQQAVKRGARLIVIDSVVGYLNAMAQERFLVLQLHELLSYLGQAGVLSVLVLGQVTRDAAPLSPVDISYLADTVIVTSMNANNGDTGRSVAVYKRRSGAHETQARSLTLGPVGIKVGDQVESKPVPEALRG